MWVSLRGVTKIGWIQDGQIEDDYHNQIKWEWISLSQIELVWVRVLCKMGESKLEEFKMAAIIKWSQNEWVKFFCVNGGNQSWQCEWVSEEKLRWLNPRSGFHVGKIQDGCHHQVRWELNEFESDWISLSQSPEWSESVFKWIWEMITLCQNPRWQCLNPTWQNSKWLPSSIWVRMNEWSFFMS